MRWCVHITMSRIFVLINKNGHLASCTWSQSGILWSQPRRHVDGWWSDCIPGSIVPGGYWYAGRSLALPMKPSYIWLVPSSAFSTVIAFVPYWFPNKLLVMDVQVGIVSRV